MKSVVFALTLLMGLLFWSAEADAQYNLRTLPTNPPAGVSFLAAFDGNTCEIFFLTAPAQLPVVTVQGSTVRLQVDYLPLANCLAEPRTHTLAVPALPAGTYQLELNIRYYLSPGNDALAQTVTFEVGPATAVGTFSIPASNWLGLLALVCAMLGFGHFMVRRGT